MMAKRTGPGTRASSSSSSAQAPRSPARTDRIVEIIDQCVSAKAIADKLGEKFLAYLLAMAIQEARASLQPKS